MRKVIIIVLLAMSVAPLRAQEEEPLTRILFIFDASNSMNGIWEKKPKIQIATRLLSSVLDSLRAVPNLEMALRVYGSEKNYLKGQDCDDTKLLVPFGSSNVMRMKGELGKLKPKGTTPIAATLETAANDFTRCPREECRNVIVLITDGIEECDGDPCAVSLALQKQGITLKPFVIGIGLDVEFREAFECVGTYFDATTEKKFKNAIGVVISQALNNTTAQVNLIDANGDPTETNVNMTFYDRNTGQVIHNYVHTMNVKGNPDTLALNPAHIYRVVAHSIPLRSNDSAEIVPGKHTIIGIRAPQGDLEFKMMGLNPTNQSLNVIVRKAGEMKTLHVQRFTEKERYIIGSYDLEVLTLPRTYIEGVEITQSHTTTIEIPQPGMATFTKRGHGYGSVYLETDKGLELVANLELTLNRESLNLQPGSYLAVFRPKSARSTIFTVQKRFTVTSGTSVSVQLN